MPFAPPDDYWIEVPAGKYVVGLLPDEAKRMAADSAAYFKVIGPEFTLNEAKSVARAYKLMKEQGNHEWAERYLLEHFPAREVDVPAFAIARRPVLLGEDRRFMSEAGERAFPGNQVD